MKATANPLMQRAPALLIGALLTFGLMACGRASEPEPLRAQMAAPLMSRPVSGQSFTIPELLLELRFIPSGGFQMGSPFDEPGSSILEGPRTQVTLSRPFWLGVTPVTHRQWRQVMGTDLETQAGKAFPGDPEPVNYLADTHRDVTMHYVSWREAMEFCARLNARARAEGSLPAGYEFTLPTEAQWEYACRAGTSTATYGGPMVVVDINHAPVLDAIAWYGGNSSVGYDSMGRDTSGWVGKQYPGGRAGPRRVGLKEPNAWGLHDMLGNVYQWCRDIPSPTLPGGRVTDPLGTVSSTDRVVRGGCWQSRAVQVRAAYRAWSMPDDRSQFIGFRIALAPVVKR